MPDYQVRFNWVVDGRSAKSITNWQIPGGTAQDLTDTADAIRAKFVQYVDNDVSNLVTLSNLSMREFNGSAPFTVDVPFTSGPWSGNNVSDMYAANAPMLVSYGSNAARPNRGRFNMSGFVEGDYSSAGWDATLRGVVTSLFDDMAAGLSIPSGASRLVIARPNFTNNTWDAFNFIDFVIPRTYVSNLRKRRPSSA